MSGIKGQNSGNGNRAKYLRIAGQALWQTSGYDESSPLFTVEEYTMKRDGKDVVSERKGLKIGSITGKLDSVYVKETQFGETVNVYMDVDIDGETVKYCVTLGLDGSFDKANVAKRMMYALMFINPKEEFTINVSRSVGTNDFISTNLWVSQGGKNLVLNPNADPEKIDKTKQTEMPYQLIELLENVRTVSSEEMKEMNMKRKLRAREDELEDIKNILISEFLPTLNADREAKQKAEAKDIRDKVAAQSDNDVIYEDKEPEQKQESKPEQKATMSMAERIAAAKMKNNK